MVDPVVAPEGLTVLHLFCNRTPRNDDDAVLTALAEAESDGAQVVTVAVLGHTAELCLMALHRDAWVLRDLQTRISRAGLAAVDSYLSVTELSEYALGLPAEAADMRLNPKLPPPGKPAWCFYPMSKRRKPGQNWYELGFGRRKELMYEHGATGRKFTGRIVQLVTASTGLDDWEWGVTLFGTDLNALKHTVYAMRYDRASAVYAEFGPFVTGLVGPAGEILERTR